MTIDLEEYSALKRKAEKLRSQADRAQGALEHHMKRLRDEFDCNSIEEAEEALEELKKEEEKIAEKYGKALEKFKKEWGDKLKNV